MQTPASVLVTGASSGIGLATARILSQSGFRVFAGVRKPTGALESLTYREVALDVTDPASIAAARRTVESQLDGGVLFAVINNAGVADIRPLEFTPLEQFRSVFEVNVFGVVAVTQTFLPLLHRSNGRIVLIGSVGGLVTIPFGSALCSSKHAIEAIADALRLELHASGIHVTCIQPASINSGSAEKLAAQLEKTIESLGPEGRSRYAAALRHFMKVTLASETAGSPPEVVALAVLKILRKKIPPSRALVGKHAFLLKFVARSLPDPIRDRLFQKLFLDVPSRPRT
jgi:NAD(P)-dependent dehydrogenase (short-subunit alcohol dehydrogenase family)